MPRHVLVIDDVATHRIVLNAKLGGAGYRITLAEDLAGVQRCLVQGMPDAVLISTRVAEVALRRLPALLNAGSAQVRTPILLIDHAGPQEGQDAWLGQTDGVIHAPIHDALLMARLRSVLRMRDLEEELLLRAQSGAALGLAEDATAFSPRATILCVTAGDAAPQEAEMFQDFAERECATVSAAHMMATLDLGPRPDLIVIDAGADDPEPAMQLLSDLRCRHETREAVLIVRFANADPAMAAMALDLGANDVVMAPADQGAMALLTERHLSRKARLAQYQSQIQKGLQLANTDPLTGLYNRRYAFSHMERLVRRSVDLGRDLAVLVLDLDRFKQVNDTYGHLTGDLILVEVGLCLAESVRGGDLVARIGGEEFLIAMPDTDLEKARSAAERLCLKIANLRFPARDKTAFGVTMSIGLSVFQGQAGEGTTFEELYAQADEALYGSKRHGRNQVTVNLSAA